MSKLQGAVLPLVIGMALAAAIGTGALAISQPRTLGPCPTEDSTNCYWDAAQHGNGSGVSFVDVDGVTYYPDVAPIDPIAPTE